MINKVIQIFGFLKLNQTNAKPNQFSMHFFIFCSIKMFYLARKSVSNLTKISSSLYSADKEDKTALFLSLSLLGNHVTFSLLNILPFHDIASSVSPPSSQLQVSFQRPILFLKATFVILLRFLRPSSASFRGPFPSECHYFLSSFLSSLLSLFPLLFFPSLPPETLDSTGYI